MKVFSLACFLGIAVAHATDASPQVSADTEEVTDLKTYWDERAAEASFMQIAISEGFTYGQCKRGCNVKNFNGNRKRCERDCDKLDQNGDTTRDRTANCFSCDGHQFGSRKWVRCMDACEARRDTAEGVCADVIDLVECKLFCIGGSDAREDCLDYYGGSGSGRRRSRNNGRRRSRNNNGYNSPSTSFDNGRRRKNNGRRRSRNNGRRNRDSDDVCITVRRSCNECRRVCSGGRKHDCLSFNNCPPEELDLEME
jgi:hypothetical protein